MTSTILYIILGLIIVISILIKFVFLSRPHFKLKTKYTLKKDGDETFDFVDQSTTVGTLKIDNHVGLVTILNIQWKFTYLGGSIFGGRKYSIYNSSQNKEYFYKTTKFGFSGMLLMDGLVYHYSAGGGGGNYRQTWHEWAWKDDHSNRFTILVSSWADVLPDRKGVLTDDRLAPESVALLTFLARYFQHDYITGH